MADRRLQVFHTVARLLSFTKAAETLHMTQPAVTFQIRQLEEHFNTRLFDRTHNRISLTAAGQRVFDYAEKIIALYGEMDSRVRELTGDVSGILIIGASTTIAEYVLPGLLGEFQSRYKDGKRRSTACVKPAVPVPRRGLRYARGDQRVFRRQQDLGARSQPVHGVRQPGGD